jgi:hypothetical protein
MTSNTKTLIAGGTLLGFLAACGGGGGGGAASTPTQQITGIQGTGFAQGAITGFGSIFVNGVEFRTTSSTITVNGRSGTESELKVGQVVTVRGSVDSNGTTGTASSVAYDDDVKGQVSSINATAGTLVVMGQTVATDGNTRFGNVADLASLVAGTDFVEVSGFRDSTGVIRATRIEKISAPSEVEVLGAVGTPIDTTAKTFRIGSLTVDYSAATTLNNFSTPTAGQSVEARGALVNGVLKATRIDGKSGATLASGDPAKVEGVITRFVSNTDFDVNGIKVTTTSSTQFPTGTSLALGAKVQAEGTANSSGVISATKVEIKASGDGRVTATVTAIDAPNNRFSVFGVQGTVSAATSFDDKSNANARPFNLSLLRTGDYVEVRGAEAAAGGLTLSFVERRDLRSQIEIHGLAKNVNTAAQTFSLVGVNVRLTSNAQCRDATGQGIACATLLANLTATSRLMARDSNGTASTPAGGLVADRVEQEN